MIGFPYLRSHNVASHNDTTGTGAELEELTDGSETTLHSHAAGTPAAHTIASHSDTTGTGAELEELTDSSETTLHSHAAVAHTVASHSDTTGTGAELEELTDGSESTLHSHAAAAHTVASHSDTSGTGAELDELTDGSTTTLHKHAGLGEGALSAYTNLDSESQAMVYNHAYLAQTDGVIHCHNPSIDAGEKMSIYVGATNDPAGAGDLIQVDGNSDGTQANRWACVSAHVAVGEYFELTSDDVSNVMNWKSFGTLAAPIDQD